MANDANTDSDYYAGGRDEFGIWTEDITPNEEYLAQKAFADDSDPDEARRWGRHLLKILVAKCDGG